MQLLSAFSRPQTIPDAPATVPKKSLWILDSWRDLVLYVGTPLLLVPAFALAQSRWSPQDIYLFVAAFGAMGHHLPGMIRAYGDRALFERFFRIGHHESFVKNHFLAEAVANGTGAGGSVEGKMLGS